MLKKLIVVLAIGSIFVGCSLFKDLEEIANAADVTMTPVDVSILPHLPSGAFDPITNPACTTLSEYSFEVFYLIHYLAPY